MKKKAHREAAALQAVWAPNALVRKTMHGCSKLRELQ
jgi:hypothetical protein